jgi:hypothetical protein
MMNFPNLYHYGALMGFSGVDGENPVSVDFSAQLMYEPISLRFCHIPKFSYGFREWITLRLPVPKTTRFTAVMTQREKSSTD